MRLFNRNIVKISCSCLPNIKYYTRHQPLVEKLATASIYHNVPCNKSVVFFVWKPFKCFNALSLSTLYEETLLTKYIHIHIYIYIYIYICMYIWMCVCVCVCVCKWTFYGEKTLNPFLKISYSCLPNVKSIINAHNRKILYPSATIVRRTCNCINISQYPLKQNCLSNNILSQ